MNEKRTKRQQHKGQQYNGQRELYLFRGPVLTTAAPAKNDVATGGLCYISKAKQRKQSRSKQSKGAAWQSLFYGQSFFCFFFWLWFSSNPPFNESFMLAFTTAFSTSTRWKNVQKNRIWAPNYETRSHIQRTSHIMRQETDGKTVARTHQPNDRTFRCDLMLDRR